MAKKIVTLIFCLIMMIPSIYTAQAGFGVSPTYIKSDIIRPGTLFERRINLLRSSADEDLEAHITIDAPEIGSWITIDKGLSFVLPRGVLRIPIIIKVDVPSDADLGNYSGQISFSIAPAGDWATGVAVSLGALIEVNLTLTKEVFSDFKIRQVKIPDFEALGKLWNNGLFSWFFRPLQIVMRIENTGNIEISPSKVALDIYGIPAKDQLDSMTSTKIDKVKPYNTEEIIVSFPTRLAVGQYWGRVKIYKNNEIVFNDQAGFTIAVPGTLVDYSSGLWNWSWLIIGVTGVFVVFSLLALIKFGFWWQLFKRLNFLAKIWRIVRSRIIAVWLEIKFKFWRWLRYKSAPSVSKKIEPKQRLTKDRL